MNKPARLGLKKNLSRPSTVIETLERRTMLSAEATTTALAESVSASVFSQSVTLTATVTTKTGAPTGTVTFLDGTASLGTATLSSEKATLSLTTLPVGTDSVTAKYAGSSSFATSTSSVVKQTVGAAKTATTLAVSAGSSVYGQSITLTAATTAVSPATGVPSGSVTFKSGSVVLGTENLSSKGVAQLSTGAIAVGTASITVGLNSSTAWSTSTSSSISHTVTAATTTTAIAETTATALLGATVNVTVTTKDISPGVGTPTGIVNLYDGKTELSTQNLSSGTFTAALPMLFTGSHSLIAHYAGSTDSASSNSSSLALTVKLPTMTTASDGLQTGITTAGTGVGAVDGQTLEVNYTGFLQNGTVFDSSLNAGRTPFDFTLGAGQVIAGWDQGCVGMKVGETRVLVIPPSLGYGATAQASIPGNSTLTFVISLLAFEHPKLVVTGANNTAITNAESPTTSNGTNFGTIKVGSSSTTESFTITNGGDAELDFTAAAAVELSGSDAEDFVLTQPTISGNAAVFTIVFKPTVKGTRTATITIPTNDPTYPNFYFTIEGTGD